MSSTNGNYSKCQQYHLHVNCFFIYPISVCNLTSTLNFVFGLSYKPVPLWDQLKCFSGLYWHHGKEHDYKLSSYSVEYEFEGRVINKATCFGTLSTLFLKYLSLHWSKEMWKCAANVCVYKKTWLDILLLDCKLYKNLFSILTSCFKPDLIWHSLF